MNKHLRKALALALAGTMSLSAVFTASASDVTSMNKLAVLQQLGVIQGEGNGVDPTKSMTRYEATALYLKFSEADANGENLWDQMLAYDSEGKDNFADAEGKSAFVSKLMAFVKNNEGAGLTGYPDGTFKPLQEMTQKEYATIMLRALGYEYGVDFTWSDVAVKALEAGIIDSINEADNDVITTIDLAEVTYDTLATTPVGSDVSLGEEIGTPVVVTETDLAVNSVEALNLKQLEVKFNKAVDKDSAEDLDNYKLDADDARLQGGSAELQEDGKTVVITLGTAGEQQEVVSLTVNDVKDTDEVELDKTTVDGVKFLDLTIPEALNLETVGEKTLKITFSEPVQSISKSSLKVTQDGKEKYISTVEASSNDNTEFNIKLYSKLEEGDVNVEIKSGIVDFANFSVMYNTLATDVSEDTSAPEVVDYRDAKPDSVVLVFNEDVTLNTHNTDNFYHTNSKNTADSVTSRADLLADSDADNDNDLAANELKLDFTTNTLPEGTAYVVVKQDAVEDLWGNEVEDITAVVEVTVDETAPTVEKVEATEQNVIKITFSEDVDGTDSDATDEGNYTLIDEDGDEVTGFTATVDEKKVTLTFSDDLSGDYVLTVEDIKDNSDNKMDDFTTDVTVDDVTAPNLANVEATLFDVNDDEYLIKVDFKDEMATEGKYSVLDLDKYIVNSESLEDVADDHDVEISLVNSGKSVEIVIEKDAFTSVTTIQVGRVADAAGNISEALASAEITIGDPNAIAVDKIEAVDTRTVKVTFADELSSIEIEDFAFNNGLEISETSVDENSDGNTVITFTLAGINGNDALAADGTVSTSGAAVTFDVVSDSDSTNIYGESVATGSYAVVDKINPELVADDEDTDANESVTVTSGSSITLNFTEDLQVPNGLDDSIAVADLVITNAKGERLVYGVDFENLVISGSTISFDLTNTEEATTSSIKVKTTDDVNYITDGSNKLDAFNITIDLEN